MRAREGSAAPVSPGWLRALVGAVCLTLLVAACRTKRPGIVYRLDSETRGWVVIVFNRPGAPPLPTDADNLIIDVPRSGLVATSTKSPVGHARDTFLLRYPDGRQAPLPSDAIRANHVGTSTWGDGKPMECEVFFVGTRAELEAAEKQDDVLARARAMLP